MTRQQPEGQEIIFRQDKELAVVLVDHHLQMFIIYIDRISGQVKLG
jgi:hypothetical protein